MTLKINIVVFEFANFIVFRYEYAYIKIFCFVFRLNLFLIILFYEWKKYSRYLRKVVVHLQNNALFIYKFDLHSFHISFPYQAEKPREKLNVIGSEIFPNYVQSLMKYVFEKVSYWLKAAIHKVRKTYFLLTSCLSYVIQRNKWLLVYPEIISVWLIWILFCWVKNTFTILINIILQLDIINQTFDFLTALFSST